MLTSQTLIVSFAGHGLMYGGVPKKEFSNFLQKHFSHINAQFYVDYNCKSYHQGIQGISNNIDETVVYLKEQFKNYERVICLGASAGGYAAILFGSLLNVDTVVAFIPQTKLRSKERDEKYRDIEPHINTTTKYHIFGDLSIQNEDNCHHISQCERILKFSNVHLTRLDGVNLAVMRNNGLLLDIMTKIIEEQVIYYKSPINNHQPNKFSQLQRFLPKRYVV
jgi:esterase/lipase